MPGQPRARGALTRDAADGGALRALSLAGLPEEVETARPSPARRGRAATPNPPARFDRHAGEAVGSWHGFEDRHDLDCGHFAAPPATGDQLRLL